MDVATDRRVLQPENAAPPGAAVGVHTGVLRHDANRRHFVGCGRVVNWNRCYE